MLTNFQTKWFTRSIDIIEKVENRLYTTCTDFKTSRTLGLDHGRWVWLVERVRFVILGKSIVHSTSYCTKGFHGLEKMNRWDVLYFVLIGATAPLLYRLP